MEVRELIKLMKAERCLRVKMGGLEVELSPAAFAPDAPEANSTAEQKPVEPPNFTLWSVQDQSPLPVFEAKAEEV